MDTIIAIIIAIVIVIIIICLNAFYIYSPVRKIEREVDSAIADVDRLIVVTEKSIIPLVENGSEKFVRLIEKTRTLESQIDNIISVAGCVFCRSPFNPGGIFCDGDLIKSPTIICAIT